MEETKPQVNKMEEEKLCESLTDEDTKVPQKLGKFKLTISDLSNVTMKPFAMTANKDENNSKKSDKDSKEPSKVFVKGNVEFGKDNE